MLAPLLRTVLANRRPLVLVRVIAATGSAPRGPGAAMLVSASGHLCGTVGGGAIEHAAIKDAQQTLKSGLPTVRDYALRNRDAADLGMVCGGDMRLLFQRIDPADHPLCAEALARIESGHLAYLATNTDTGETWLTDASPHGPAIFAQPLLTPARTYIFGAGHVAQALVPILAQCGFRVIVLDDRPDFASVARFPAAESVRIVDFAALKPLQLTGHDHAVIMTRGHEHDLIVLTAALRTPARYIGMMGSRAKRAALYKTLESRGFTSADIARIHCPIGLPIGAETPTEIAISVAAELIQSRSLPSS